MKLLFDQNLSQRLVPTLADEFPTSPHVRDFDLHRADDEAIWNFAKDNEFTIVSKDDDFHQRSFLYGHPPKVVWLRLGNCSTEQVAETLRRNVKELTAFENNPDAAFVALS